ncbi:MAG TPA: ROK family protein, partial [Streptosporangiaceae bacterium]
MNREKARTSAASCTGVAWAGQEIVVAVDVGGTVIKALAVGGDGQVLCRVRMDTAAGEGGDAVLVRIAAFCEDLAARIQASSGRPPNAFGIAVPGVVDEAAGVARFAANIGWRDVPLRNVLARRLGVPVALSHDVRAAGIAEARFGAARGAHDFLLLQIGTGIAGALVLGGQPYAGAHFLGGEIGHVPAAPLAYPGGPAEPAAMAGRGSTAVPRLRCGCGGFGCLETVASAAALARRYQNESGGRHADAAEVIRLAGTGDPTAAGIWRDAISALAGTLAWYQGVLDPDLVVIGGGLSRAGAALLGPLRRELSALL